MKKLLQLAAGIVLFVAIPITIFLAGQRQEIRKKAAPATTLAIMPTTLTKQSGDVFTVEIVIDTGENQVVATELHIAFDQAKLEAQTISNGPLFPNVLASGIVEPGAASITVGAADAKQPVRGSGTVATVKFLAKDKTESPSSIKLGSNTFVGGLGEGATNVLAGTTPSSVTITKDVVVLSPTPTPSPTHTPTPTEGVSLATQSAQISPLPTSSASTSASKTGDTLTILSPASKETATSDTPTIQGKANPGAIITVTVYSTPQTVTVTADANGNWSITPVTPLEPGPHNIVASATNQTGQTVTAETAFVVASASAIGGSKSTIPISGSIEVTLGLMFIGFMVLCIGLWRPLGI